MLKWMGNLPLHTFQPRHFESREPLNEPLQQALRTLQKDNPRCDNDEDVENDQDKDEEEEDMSTSQTKEHPE